MTPKIDSLESIRLLLEPRKEHHAFELFELLCEPDLYHYTRRIIPPNPEYIAKGFKDLESLVSPDGQEIWLGWMARSKADLRPVGIFEISLVQDEAHIAYTVLKNHWGSGFAAEAVEAMMKFISENYEPKKFIIGMDTRNRSSIKVAEKLGFEFVKVINNATFLKGLVSHEFEFQKIIY